MMLIVAPEEGNALQREFVLFCPLSSVALAAAHLTVLGCGGAALAPWVYVVGFHFAQLKVLATVGTNALLPRVCRFCHSRCELADI